MSDIEISFPGKIFNISFFILCGIVPVKDFFMFFFHYIIFYLASQSTFFKATVQETKATVQDPQNDRSRPPKTTVQEAK